MLVFRRYSDGTDRRKAGDTIVEVLISITVISLVLTTAYVITNKNNISMQANQERIQAQHIAEAQIEALRSSGGIPQGLPSDSCFNTVTDAWVSDASCKSISNGPGSGATYTASISKDSSGVYAVTITWTSLGSNKVNGNNVTMYYEL